MISTTRTGRQSRIAELLASSPVRSQADLLALLARDGIEVTQATLSRDLLELGAVKIRSGRALVYAVPDQARGGRPGAARTAPTVTDVPARLKRACEELLVTADPSANLVIVRTPPGAASYLASAIDLSRLAGVLGTLAGDDTVLVITTNARTGPRVARQLMALTGTPD